MKTDMQHRRTTLRSKHFFRVLQNEKHYIDMNHIKSPIYMLKRFSVD